MSHSDSEATASCRICILTEPNPVTYVSGQSVRFQRLLDFLVEETDDDVVLVTSEVVKQDPPKLWRGKVPIHYTQGLPLLLYPSITLPFDWSAKTFRLIWNHQPHVIHVSSPGLFLFVGWIASRLFQIPLVASYHTHLPVYLRSYLPPVICVFFEWIVWQLLWLVHSFADITVATSPQIKLELENHSISRCVVWPKGIDTERFHPRNRDAEMRHRMSNGMVDDFLMVYVGRLASEKRVKDLKGVLLSMPQNSRLCVIGTGPQEAELHDFFRGTNTVFLGQLLGLELSQAYALADAFVMPSDSETLGFVVLESLASGVPCVATNAGGIPDIISDGQNGFLVPPGDTEALSARLRQLQDDPELRQRLVKRGRNGAEKLTWGESMKAIRLDFYAQARSNFHERYEQKFSRWLLTNYARIRTKWKVAGVVDDRRKSA